MLFDLKGDSLYFQWHFLLGDSGSRSFFESLLV